MNIKQCQKCGFDVAEQDVYLAGSYTYLCEACSDNVAFEEDEDTITFTEEQVKAMLKDAYESGWASSHPQYMYREADAEDCAKVIMSRYQS